MPYGRQRLSKDNAEAMRMMQMHGIRRLPIVSTDGRATSIITLDDILRVLSKELALVAGLVAQEQIRERAAKL